MYKNCKNFVVMFIHHHAIINIIMYNIYHMYEYVFIVKHGMTFTHSECDAQQKQGFTISRVSTSNLNTMKCFHDFKENYTIWLFP